jgi:hypothetical protein
VACAFWWSLDPGGYCISGSDVPSMAGTAWRSGDAVSKSATLCNARDEYAAAPAPRCPRRC